MNELTIQEVIDHCEETAKRIEDNVKYCRDWLMMPPQPLTSKHYLEHKQTAEWLKELQWYREKLEQGAILRMPYKLRQDVWVVERYNVHPFTVISVELDEIGTHVKIQYAGTDPHLRYWTIRLCVEFMSIPLFTNEEDAHKAAESYRRNRDNED